MAPDDDDTEYPSPVRGIWYVETVLQGAWAVDPFKAGLAAGQGWNAIGGLKRSLTKRCWNCLKQLRKDAKTCPCGQDPNAA